MLPGNGAWRVLTGRIPAPNLACQPSAPAVQESLDFWRCTRGKNGLKHSGNVGIEQNDCY
jgi:hypothetical protein